MTTMTSQKHAAGDRSDTSIRPFRLTFPEKDFVELRRRSAATRWPTKELAGDRSQGVQLATLRELARYWATEYDSRRLDARLNALAQFTTEILTGALGIADQLPKSSEQERAAHDAVACWEHYNPLARYAMMADGEQIHSAMSPGSIFRLTQPSAVPTSLR